MSQSSLFPFFLTLPDHFRRSFLSLSCESSVCFFLVGELVSVKTDDGAFYPMIRVVVVS